MMLSQKTQITCTQRQAAPSRISAKGSRACVVVRASAEAETASAKVSRRSLLATAGLVAASSVIPSGAALADVEYTLFQGYASPPTSYGGYGGNAQESVKYTFEYPSGWKSEVPSKVEKGTQGVDGRVVNPRVKGQRAFVITLSRAGEDNKSFRLTDLDSTFQGFAGADYDLQDSLSLATDIKKTTRQVNGIDFYDYEIDSPEVRYLSSITTKDGKVFALFVKTPAKAYSRNEAELRHILESFKLL